MSHSHAPYKAPQGREDYVYGLIVRPKVAGGMLVTPIQDNWGDMRVVHPVKNMGGVFTNTFQSSGAATPVRTGTGNFAFADGRVDRITCRQDIDQTPVPGVILQTSGK